MWQFNIPTCNSCCCKIGIAVNPTTTILPFSCLDDHVEVVQNIHNDIGKLDNSVCVVYAGLHSLCGDPVTFARNDWEKVKNWIEKGGRLWFNGEYICQGDNPFHCLQERAKANEFIAAIGSSMVLGALCCGCSCFEAGNGDAAIAQDIQLYSACTNEVSGGTSVLLATGNQSVNVPPCNTIVGIAIEQIGQGFVIVSGDSNIFSGCVSLNSDYNCELMQRYLEWDSADLI